MMFWREADLTRQEKQLLDSLFAAHHKAAYRENISSHAVQAAMFGSGDYTKAIAAGLLTLGGVHAPIAQTMKVLAASDPSYEAGRLLESGSKVPGWGSSFVKGKPDPDWDDVAGLIATIAPNIDLAIQSVTALLKFRDIYPNPSTYTAATAIALGIPASVAPWLFIQGRLNAWTQLCISIPEQT